MTPEQRDFSRRADLMKAALETGIPGLEVVEALLALFAGRYLAGFCAEHRHLAATDLLLAIQAETMDALEREERRQGEET